MLVVPGSGKASGAKIARRLGGHPEGAVAQQDEVVLASLGAIAGEFVALKEGEWREYHRTVTQWELSIDNQLNARFSNSVTATDIHTQGRVVTVTLTVPYTADEVDLYGINTGGASGATFVLTNGARSLTLTVGALAIMDNSPTVGGNGEILLQLTGMAKSTGSTKELAITNDSTP